MNITARETRQGSFIPPFYYGYSYRRYDRMVDVWHVIPLNYLIRWMRHVNYLWNKIRSKPSWLDTQIILAEKRACDMAYESIYKNFEDNVRETVDKYTEEKEEQKKP